MDARSQNRRPGCLDRGPASRRTDAFLSAARTALETDIKRLLLLFSGLCLGAAPCAAGEITQKQGPATLEIRFDGPTPKLALALADLLTVKLTVEGRAGLRVRAPDRFAADFPWLLVELSKVERSPLGSERETWRLVYKLAPRGPGRKIALRFPNVQEIGRASCRERV